MEVGVTKSIYLIRHCKAEGQEPDAKLTREGLEQVDLLADFLAPKQIDYIVSSTYLRAIATIQPTALQRGLMINTDTRLCERVLSKENYSGWQEKLLETFYKPEMRLPGGESSKEAMERGISVLNDLIKMPQKHIAVITHGNLLCLMLRYFDERYGFKEWESMSNPDVFEITLVQEKTEVSIQRIWK